MGTPTTASHIALMIAVDEDTKEDLKGQSGDLIVQLEAVKTRAQKETSLIACGKIAFVAA